MEELGHAVFKGDSPAVAALKEVDAEMKRNDVEAIKKYYNIRMHILDRISTLVSNENRLDHLTGTLKSITEELAALDAIDRSQSNSDDPISYIKIVTDQLQARIKGVNKVPAFPDKDGDDLDDND